MLPIMSMSVSSFLSGAGDHDLSVSRIAFDFIFWCHITIYWYGLLFAVALLFCMVLAVQAAHRLKGDDILDFLADDSVHGYWARLYYVAFVGCLQGESCPDFRYYEEIAFTAMSSAG